MMTCTELSQRKYSLILGEIKCFFFAFFFSFIFAFTQQDMQEISGAH